MTGLELIRWIINNKAEDKIVIIEHRDSGGSYHTAERLGEFSEPALVMFSEEEHGIISTIEYEYDAINFKPNGIIL